MASEKIEKVLAQIMVEAECTRREAWSLIDTADGLDEAEWKKARYDEAQVARAKRDDDQARAQAQRQARLQEAWKLGFVLDA